MKKLGFLVLLLGATLVIGCSPVNTAPNGQNNPNQQESEHQDQEEQEETKPDDEDEDVEWFPWTH